MTIKESNMQKSEVVYTFTPSKVGPIKCSDYAFDVSAPCMIPYTAIKAGDELVLKVDKNVANTKGYVIVRTAPQQSGDRASKFLI